MKKFISIVSIFVGFSVIANLNAEEKKSEGKGKPPKESVQPKKDEEGSIKSLDETHREINRNSKGAIKQFDEDAYKAKKKLQKFLNLRTDQDSQGKDSSEKKKISEESKSK
jgi:hypothetical protein